MRYPGQNPLWTWLRSLRGGEASQCLEALLVKSKSFASFGSTVLGHVQFAWKQISDRVRVPNVEQNTPMGSSNQRKRQCGLAHAAAVEQRSHYARRSRLSRESEKCGRPNWTCRALHNALCIYKDNILAIAEISWA